MKKEKWKGHHHPEAVWLAKLQEELGEVAEAFLHWQEGDADEYEHMVDELEHVKFIATCAIEDMEEP